ILTDVWEGLDHFFEPGSEVIAVHSTGDVLAALDLADAELDRVRRNARERVLGSHTSQHRADELIELVSAARSRPGAAMPEVA
ncbi:MAG: glycosyltransferase, partial [Nitratireductor sp.]|nr:glycosyltransferase [Nitratireductor sp.]